MPERKHLPDTRHSITRTFRLGEDTYHVVVGLYDDGTPGELMLFDRRMGNEAHSLFDALLYSISEGLQHGVSLDEYISKLRGMRFSPDGMTGDKEFPMAASKLDLLAQWLQRLFAPKQEEVSP